MYSLNPIKSKKEELIKGLIDSSSNTNELIESIQSLLPKIKKEEKDEEEEKFKEVVHEWIRLDNNIRNLNKRKKYLEKIISNHIDCNNSPYEYSYERMEEANRINEIIKEELLEIAWSPNRDLGWYYSVDELERIMLHFGK